MNITKKILHKNTLSTLLVTSLSILFLIVLFFMGHTKNNVLESCTGIVINRDDNMVTLEIVTGKYQGELANILLETTEVIPEIGSTVAVQVENIKNTLSAYLTSGYAEYETAIIKEILADSCEQDSVVENAYRGAQQLLITIKSGQYKNTDFIVSNTVGPIYNQPMEVGDKISVILSTDADGTVRGTVYEYNRTMTLCIILSLFTLFTVLVGGKTGVRSLLGLGIALVSLLFILLPLLLKGYPTLLTTFAICTNITILSLVLLGGTQKKTICAILGTLSGMLFAIAFSLLASKIARIDGLRMEYAEPLLQLRQTGASNVGIRNILTAGVMISALGAVMDVAMSISSSVSELNKVNPDLTHKELWTSGMHIAQDMVGTMTNTLVLAIFGSSLMLILYLYSLELPTTQLLSSSYLSLELITSIASSVGIILSVPLTVTISVFLFKKQPTNKAN